MYNTRLFLDLILALAALTTPFFYAAPTASAVGLVAFMSPLGTTGRPLLRRQAKAKALLARSLTYTVTATIYEAVANQTDSEPFITADNSRIKPQYGTKKRWMALSRDLLKPWGGQFAFGDHVRVMGISTELDGVYTVHDTMNRRHRHCMDVLAHPSENLDIFAKGVKIQKVAHD